ncbi:MAG: CRISPR-associated protein Cas4 [Eubacteriales bacterium]|nr:CRISPR-associated protein Cas4 [Eubacteriales bacterium]
MDYKEDDFLQLSGLQHFKFCRRQWALIHVENLWEENLRTVEGRIQHARAHDEQAVERRGDRLITRAVRVFSPSLGITGSCDVVEYFRGENGIPLAGRDGLWQPLPIEYKHGQCGQHTAADALQLCAQAMCLEQMLCCTIPEGAIFYEQTRRREPIAFTGELRREVQAALEEMHGYLQRGYTPRVKPTKSCNACSLKDLCLPKMLRAKSAKSYLNSHLEDTL